MVTLKNIILLITFTLIVNGCGSDRANNAIENEKNVSGVVIEDSDGDGISNDDELNIYHTNPNNSDTDGDGLSDSDEIKVYDTNATNPDTDGDALLDGEEVHQYRTNPKNVDTDSDNLRDGEEVKLYDTNATNPDTDGDCLLDGFEILHYETNATSTDTDGDSIADGIEIYSNISGELNMTCLSTPETLLSGYNPNPAKDGIPDAAHDIINALDPTNDSDGDGQSNIKELECAEGDASDKNATCPYATEGSAAESLQEHGYAYVPGGFDVDGDGIKEGGFWVSRYHARVKVNGNLITSADVIQDVGIINSYASTNFKVLNKNVQVTNYSEDYLNETTTLAGKELDFSENLAKTEKRITGVTPYLALVLLHRAQILDKNTSQPLDMNITMPTLKQYVHLKMLLDADFNHGGDGRHIRNGLLGVDVNVPMFSYTLVIDEFGENSKEYVKNFVQIRDIHGDKSFDIAEIPTWWDVNSSQVDVLNRGANATQDLGFGIGPQKDAYGIIVRAGRVLDVTQGLSGALTDDEGTTNGISFRAATDYLY